MYVRQRSLSFGNHSESSRGDAETDVGMDGFPVPYNMDKMLQGEYYKKLSEKLQKPNR